MGPLQKGEEDHAGSQGGATTTGFGERKGEGIVCLFILAERKKKVRKRNEATKRRRGWGHLKKGIRGDYLFKKCRIIETTRGVKVRAREKGDGE